MADLRGQMILLFAFVVVIVILTLAYVHAQNVIAGLESSRAMMSFPKEEIRNLKQLHVQYHNSPLLGKINSELKVLCAKNGWVCYIGVDKVEFKSVEVDFCEGNC
ncbi:MAG: hypothetical protein ABWW66_03835 [Archaeoglobaceae archaeon]